jgi:thioesterase domain-containing protein
VLCYRELLDWVPADTGILAVQSRGDGAPRTLAGMAAGYVAELLPQLPGSAQVFMLGWSMGGVVAHEMTRLLEHSGVAVAALTMIDSWVGNPALAPDAALQGSELLMNFARDLLQTQVPPAALQALAQLPAAEQAAGVRALLGREAGPQLSAAEFDGLLAEHQANFNALLHHRPQATRVAPLQYRAMLRSEFPLLVPFPAEPPSAQPPRPAVQLQDTHFSIARGERLRRITENTLSPGDFA